MARNGSGTYAVVNTFTSGTTITASSHNANWSDIATEMTNSVAVDGQSTMTGTLKLPTGTVSLPAMTFGTDTDSGIYRIGANNIGVAVNGTKILDIATTGLSVGTIGYSTTLTGTSTNASALAVGANGATNPVIKVDASTASVATGVSITGKAAAAGVNIAAISSGTNELLRIDAKGSGNIQLGAISTGSILFSRAAVPASDDGAALGGTSNKWSDLFLASGSVINFNSGDVTLTHSSGTLTLSGTLDAPIQSSSATSGMGYATGAGGTVTQGTSVSTGVTLNKICGQITTFDGTWNNNSVNYFTVTNSAVAATDTVVASLVSWSGSNPQRIGVVTAGVSSGSFDIGIINPSSSSESGQGVINFAVIKAVSS